MTVGNRLPPQVDIYRHHYMPGTHEYFYNAVDLNCPSRMNYDSVEFLMMVVHAHETS